MLLFISQNFKMVLVPIPIGAQSRDVRKTQLVGQVSGLGEGSSRVVIDMILQCQQHFIECSCHEKMHTCK